MGQDLQTPFSSWRMLNPFSHSKDIGKILRYQLCFFTLCLDQQNSFPSAAPQDRWLCFLSVCLQNDTCWASPPEIVGSVRPGRKLDVDGSLNWASFSSLQTVFFCIWLSFQTLRILENYGKIKGIFNLLWLQIEELKIKRIFKSKVNLS